MCRHLSWCSALHAQPSKVAPELAGRSPLSGLSILSWDAHRNATILVFDLASSDPKAAPLRRFEMAPMYFNHHVNAWEDGDNIVLDLIGYDSGDFLMNPHGFANLDVMKNRTARQLLPSLNQRIRRYSLDMSAVSGDDWASFVPFDCQLEGNTTFAIELPRFNDRYHGAIITSTSTRPPFYPTPYTFHFHLPPSTLGHIASALAFMSPSAANITKSGREAILFRLRRWGGSPLASSSGEYRQDPSLRGCRGRL